MATRRVYLDHNATTPLHPEVAQSMTEAIHVFGNPSSMHAFGREARALVENARANVAGLINALPEEVIFVGSGSEGNNTVLSILSCPSEHCTCDRRRGPNGIVTTRIEHPCILETSKCLKGRGIPVVLVGVDGLGKVQMDELDNALNDGVGILSVMMANNEIGTIQDIKAIAARAHAKGILVHTDAVQATGKIPVDVRDLDVDFLTVSAHKIYGPKGIGALYVRRGTTFCPLVRGGHQERGRRAGTENTLGIVGFGKAAELRTRDLAEEMPRLRALREALRQGIEERIPDVHFNGHPIDCVPNTLNVSFDGAEGESILLYLDLEGIAVSTGSACASGSLDPSHVLLATGLPVERAHGSIRMSLGRDNSEADVDYVLDTLPGIIRRIRDMSTAYRRRTP
ncbi:MAG TPA: aminotransferase class V-fold PLP-dependent enzyme [Candidatus Hydrogenedentes bacterium]|nr:aminotransferase class V-fold PLP-dependent enzyme [Candidatus Hydrogenedentota bacterium]HPG69854.1 aminotransferase class V-fold PLP-dependent enzyme [Candidatus Hydrogenedentota bacterium]